MLEQRRPVLGLGLIAGLVCLITLLVAPPLLARADEPPARPPALPPREPTPTPIPVFPSRPPIDGHDTDHGPSSKTSGAAIELLVQFLAGSPPSVEWREGLWTMVQWQDGLGEWHDVHGWRATLDEVNGDEGIKVWYVSEDQFGEGTYSWIVYPDPDDEFITRSAPFYMPGSTGQTRQVKVAVGPRPASTTKSTTSSLPPSGGRQHPGLWKFLTVGLVVLLVAQLLPQRDRWFK